MASYAQTKAHSNYRKTSSSRSASANKELNDALSYNVPVVGNLKRSAEEIQFAKDLYKNTGRTIKYPGRFYSNNIKNAFYEGTVLYRGSGISRYL